MLILFSSPYIRSKVKNVKERSKNQYFLLKFQKENIGYFYALFLTTLRALSMSFNEFLNYVWRKLFDLVPVLHLFIERFIWTKLSCSQFLYQRAKKVEITRCQIKTVFWVVQQFKIKILKAKCYLIGHGRFRSLLSKTTSFKNLPLVLNLTFSFSSCSSSQ